MRKKHFPVANCQILMESFVQLKNLNNDNKRPKKMKKIQVL